MAWAPTHSVVIHLLERLVADGALEDDPLEHVGFVTGHQLYADHLSFPHSHIAEHLRRGTERTVRRRLSSPEKPLSSEARQLTHGHPTIPAPGCPGWSSPAEDGASAGPPHVLMLSSWTVTGL